MIIPGSNGDKAQGEAAEWRAWATFVLFVLAVSSPMRAARTRLTKLSVHALTCASSFCTLMSTTAQLNALYRLADTSQSLPSPCSYCCMFM